MRSIIIACMFCGLALPATASAHGEGEDLLLGFRVQNMTLSLPFSTVPLDTPLQPLFDVSVGRPLMDWGWGGLEQEVGVGTYFQRSLFRSVHLQTATSVPFRLPHGAYHALQIGASWARLFHPIGSFPTGEPDGNGLSALQWSLGLALGYDGLREDTIPLRVSLEYGVVFQYLLRERPHTFGRLWPFTAIGIGLDLPLGSWIRPAGSS